MSTYSPKLTLENIDNYEIITKGQGRVIKYTDKKTGNSGSNTMFDVKLTKDGVETGVLFKGGNETNSTKEDPYSNCLKAFLIKNDPKLVQEKDKKGNIVLDDNGNPKIINLAAPYILMVTQRELNNDPEFDKFEELTSKVKRKILDGFMKNKSAYNSSYEMNYSTLNEMYKHGCKFNYCRHPKKKDSDGNPTTEPNETKPKYAAFNVYENTSIAFPIDKTDENGNIVYDKNGSPVITRKEIPKEKLAQNGVVFYGWPVCKTTRVGKGSGGLYFKSYSDGFVVFDLKKEKKESNHKDLFNEGYKTQKVNPDISKALSSLKLDFEDEDTTNETNLTNNNTKTDVDTKTKNSIKTNETTNSPSVNGELEKKEETNTLPKNSPKVNLKGLESFD